MKDEQLTCQSSSAGSCLSHRLKEELPVMKESLKEKVSHAQVTSGYVALQQNVVKIMGNVLQLHWSDRAFGNWRSMKVNGCFLHCVVQIKRSN
jgi:hypothetical protein